MVVLIIGVLLSLAALSFNNTDSGIDEEARRLQALIILAGQEAVLQGRELAMEFSSDGYSFLVYDGASWQALNDDEILRQRDLPDGLAVDYQAEGEGMSAKNNEDNILPRIYFLSSGEVTPFHLTLHRRGGSGGFSLEGDARGKVAMSGSVDEM